MHPWLQRLRHDLLKRALWTARDLRDTGARPTDADRRALLAGLRDLLDGEGKPTSAKALWALLLEEAPEESTLAPAFRSAAAAFGAALDQADAAVGFLEREPARWPGALETVLHLEPAFDRLARSMNRGVDE